jgi:nucleoside-diphosphate-sugar epimerase
MIKILITGASGFIGSNLCQYLNEKKIDVVKVNRENGFDLSKRGWTNGIKEEGVDIIVHLAQSNNHRDFEKQAEDIFDINVSATQEILEWSRLNGVKRFIYTSSFNVYEINSMSREESSKVKPESFYGLTKLISEQLVGHYSSFFETIILRLNTVYGPNQAKALIPQMIQKLNNNETIYLAKGEGVILSPIYVDDVSKIFLKLIKSNKNFGNEIINIAGEEIVSLEKIVKILSKYLNLNPNIEKTNNELKCFISDSTKLNTFLNNQFPFKTIEMGLKEVCNTHQSI